MLLNELEHYVDTLTSWKKVIPTVEYVELDYGGFSRVVTSTTEVYEYASEQELLQKLASAIELDGYAGSKKRFFPAKTNKQGDIIKDEFWQLTLTMNH